MTEEKDPFAPLPLPESVSGATKVEAPVAAPAPASVSAGWQQPPPPDPVATIPIATAPIATAPIATAPIATAPIAAEPLAMEPMAYEEPLVPAVYDDAALRAAVGVTPRADDAPPPPPTKKPPRKRDVDDEDDDDREPRSKKTMVVTALSIVVGGGIAALVFLGKANAGRYSISCETERVVVERGRSFPPWGWAPMPGDEWKPVKIAPEFVCHPQTTEDEEELAKWYAATVLAQARTLVTDVARVDEAEALLKQTMLLTRVFHTEDDVKNTRKDVDQLLGDVGYVRAMARVKQATDTLADAAKQLDAANALNPAHFTDSAGQALHMRSIVDELKGGPAAVKSDYLPLPADKPERAVAPPGVALPVEPGEGSGTAEPAPVAPDAGVPTGGVLL